MDEKIINSKEAMALAIQEAEKGLGHVHPNPPVGCVILDKEGMLLSKGYHKSFGSPHAEIDALNKVTNKEKLKGATVFVTLEPCSHFGKTPPCADELAKYPINKIVYGLRDPNPLVSGRGLEKLKSAGIQVEEINELKDSLEMLAEQFLTNMKEKRCFLAFKVATTLDGISSLKNGESQWITNPAARDHVHFLRAQYAAVGVGVGTLLQDNPKLNVRHLLFPNKKNKVVIFDPNGKSLPEISKLHISIGRSSDDILVCANDQLSIFNTTQAKILKCKVNSETNFFDMPELLKVLFEQGVYSLFLEGGAKTFGLILQQKTPDRLYQFISPTLIGSESGNSWIKNYGVMTLDQRPRFSNIETKNLDGDILVTGRLKS